MRPTSLSLISGRLCYSISQENISVTKPAARVRFHDSLKEFKRFSSYLDSKQLSNEKDISKTGTLCSGIVLKVIPTIHAGEQSAEHKKSNEISNEESSDHDHIRPSPIDIDPDSGIRSEGAQE
jgi:hypothetical protein